MEKALRKLDDLLNQAVSLGEKIALWANPCRVRSVALPTEPIPHASVERQRARYGITEEKITKVLTELAEEA